MTEKEKVLYDLLENKIKEEGGIENLNFSLMENVENDNLKKNIKLFLTTYNNEL